MVEKLLRAGLSATLHDVAARSGVSIATASRALNGLQVSEQALERVRAAADELGYVANGTARSLRNVRTMTMGAVFRSLTAPTSLELLDALSAAVDPQGYSLFVSTARGDDAHFDTLMRRMLERRVDAVFCFHPHGDAPSLALYRAAGIPVLALLHGDPKDDLPLIATSFRQGGEDAIARLKELGHQKIAVINSSRGLGALGAVVTAAESAGLDVDVEGPLSGPFDGMAFLRRNMAADQPATAIVALYEHATRIREAADQLGVDVPGDLSICAVHHNAGERGVSTRAFSAIHVNFDLAGNVAAEAMIRWLAGVPPPAETNVEIAGWVERSTTGPARA